MAEVKICLARISLISWIAFLSRNTRIARVVPQDSFIIAVNDISLHVRKVYLVFPAIPYSENTTLLNP